MRRGALRRKRHREQVAGELELMPMINVFMAIIPLLLLSAAFVPVTIIQASSQPSVAMAEEQPLPEESFELTVFIQPHAYVIEASGVGSRNISRPSGAGESTAAEAARSQLAHALAEIVALRPVQREVRIVAESSTRYEEIVDVMDVARGAGLPEVALSDATQDW
jgi:biopolymer transport protein ExbD